MWPVESMQCTLSPHPTVHNFFASAAVSPRYISRVTQIAPQSHAAASLLIDLDGIETGSKLTRLLPKQLQRPHARHENDRPIVRQTRGSFVNSIDGRRDQLGVDDALVLRIAMLEDLTMYNLCQTHPITITHDVLT
jgi:hypothetical protein